MRKSNTLNNLLIKCLAILALGLAGCKSIYMPTTPNVPLFQHEHQGQVEFNGFFNGMNLKTAYTPVNHFAIQANGHYVKQFTNSSPDPQLHKYLELAAGGYHCFQNKTVIEFYMGYGQGKSVFQANNLTSSLLVSAKGHYKKAYAQINLGHHKINNDMYGICLRVADIRYTYTDANLADLVNTISDHPSIEPYFYLSMKLADHLSLIGHVGLTFMKGANGQSEDVTMRTNFVNVGVGLRLALGDGTE